MISGERFSVVYRLAAQDQQEAYAKAQDICIEQTVEFPVELIPAGLISDHIVGRLESFEFIGSGFYRIMISYAVETAANEFTQLLNVIFGNISIKSGIWVERLLLPEVLLNIFKGPRFGRGGLRQLLDAPERPLLHTALKPMGLSADALAELAYQCALGGIDIIKDDHGLTNQPFAPFEERVALCAQAVARANRQSGGSSIYVANVTAAPQQIVARAKFARDAGAGGLLIAPALTGYEAMRLLAEDDDIKLPIICHPAFQGSYVTGGGGIAHFALYGQLARLAGADATIYPNFGGRFSFSRDECENIVQGTKVAMGSIRTIFPSPGGGISLDRIPELLQVYGKDVIFLVGGGLFKHGPDIKENCRYFRNLVEEFSYAKQMIL